MSGASLSVVSPSVTVRAPAKVNLHLGVGPRRPDGYHDLVTVFQALSLHDDITVRAAPELTVRTRGEGAAFVADDQTNLAYRAAVALAAWANHGSGLDIDIDKAIPVAGGMAGGSADAAGTLVAVAELWKLDIDRAALSALAADLGSDVPFILYGGTALGTGRGEQLVPVLSRGEFHWVLALADGGLSTPKVFAELDRLRDGRPEAGPGEPARPDDLLAALASGDPHAVAPLLYNDLQPAALGLKPALRRTLRAGTEAGALGGIVSGSGPTCAFLCADQDSAVAVAAELAGAGVARGVRVAGGPVPGAKVVDHG
ncbi:4-(cytidine 5'-diphospho)-2-C-methyl-D-erythritol kinase [Gordonia amarae]|uniref:4-diphosphocytidyl-2-C-methyl-D-erythritol kinase n=1 Tax=Gordonia amarae TaxID=36821 RepID=A0A857KUS4_9ACTN|nr:4-(cytidine 5'-diphospho)-2-C-methyl-D-erythritol kinase [Gordonia amarae]MCS3878050.1 4-diphosphocytidyl-2-C-methyl-D-erythritol kinase [Gordonia amarae]QHN16744.1 4-(cytidine 5'-diphospho)-2-C-methyl-D-erythritol kinase [Gordonia amarae]QHN21269.1 4-(cytidine 5'-diphospho)-2-C-methyl-D-erythritol kinase [Gordonia amarae]QHN30123.1 4-(cytidine 5'-diphospho)-2-C-methyl-D-erythritol kinase [Gordonia amarae]QHN38896.1 4-(cytidine 5'-diphospho)-2-C-methyl-D-erythritol kinase [Gordonia amarae]